MGLSISLAVHHHFQKCTLSNLNMALEHQFLDVLEPVLFFFVFVCFSTGARRHRVGLYSSIFIIDYDINTSLLLSVQLHL